MPAKMQTDNCRASDDVLLLQLEEMRKNEDPRLSFSTPEFKEAQRIFTDGFKVMDTSFVGCVDNKSSISWRLMLNQ